jgi:hypothetical protein
MNKMVHEHYPAAKLPDDLRGEIDPHVRVTVTVAVEQASPEQTLSLEELLALRRPPYRTAEEIDEDVRRGRGERDG